MKPLLVTMGDAAGIGPEIIVRAFERGEMHDAVVVGDPAVLRRAGAPMTAVIEHPADTSAVPRQRANRGSTRGRRPVRRTSWC